MQTDFDLIVIGAGSAGLAAARFAAQLGVRVALVERDQVGGDCTWNGCVPTKALLHAAHVVHQARAASSFGLPGATGPANLSRVLDHVHAAVRRVAALESPEVLSQEGIDVRYGNAQFLDPHTIDVAGRQITSRRFIICTGAEPATPPIAGLAETPYCTYRDILRVQQLPQHCWCLEQDPWASSWRRRIDASALG